MVSGVKIFQDNTVTKNRIALRRLDMPLTPAVADAPLVASRHVGKRISLSAIGSATRKSKDSQDTLLSNHGPYRIYVAML